MHLHFYLLLMLTKVGPTTADKVAHKWALHTRLGHTALEGYPRTGKHIAKHAIDKYETVQLKETYFQEDRPRNYILADVIILRDKILEMSDQQYIIIAFSRL